MLALITVTFPGAREARALGGAREARALGGAREARARGGAREARARGGAREPAETKTSWAAPAKKSWAGPVETKKSWFRLGTGNFPDTGRSPLSNTTLWCLGDP